MCAYMCTYSTVGGRGRSGELKNVYTWLHKVYVYIKSTRVYVPSSELGLSQPLSRQLVCPSPQNGGGGGGGDGTLACGDGLEESQFQRLEKKFSTLPPLCMASSTHG
jgi:hypothetical protein